TSLRHLSLPASCPNGSLGSIGSLAFQTTPLSLNANDSPSGSAKQFVRRATNSRRFGLSGSVMMHQLQRTTSVAQRDFTLSCPCASVRQSAGKPDLPAETVSP